jgi:hypothetical protein
MAAITSVMLGVLSKETAVVTPDLVALHPALDLVRGYDAGCR